MVIKTLEDEWYVVIKAYKLTDFEILRDFFCIVIIYACPRYPYIRVYRLYDTDVTSQQLQYAFQQSSARDTYNFSSCENGAFLLVEATVCCQFYY